MREMLPEVGPEIKVYDEYKKMSIDEKRAELWSTFESIPQIAENIRYDYAPWL